MMWYTIIPTFALTMLGISLDKIFPAVLNTFVLGRPYTRPADTPDQCIHFVRDLRLSGGKTPYKQMGLESLD